MGDLGSQLNQLTPDQRQMVLARAQQEANQQVMQGKQHDTGPLWRRLTTVFISPVSITLSCRNDEAHGSGLL